MKRRGIEEIMSDKKTCIIIAIIGVVYVNGVILYKTGFNLEPLVVFGMCSSIITCVLMVYFVLLHKK